MKLKLIDVEVNRCIDGAEEPTFIFEKENGATIRVKGFYWNWGWLVSIQVDNIIDFADYVSKQDFPEDTDFDYNWLDNLVDEAERAEKVIDDVVQLDKGTTIHFKNGSQIKSIQTNGETLRGVYKS